MGLIPSRNHTGITAIAIGFVASFFAIIATILRVWARKINGARLDASDWTCISGLIVALVLVGSTVNIVIQGLGLPIDQVHPENLIAFTKALLVGFFTWTASTTLVRISMILLYIRLFPTRRFVIICWIFLIENVLCWIASYAAVSLICQPFAYNWDHTIPGGHCGNQQRLYIWNGIQNLLHDIITIVLPMPLLWNLHLPWSKKISLTLIFAMGSAICVITLIRTIEISSATALQNVTLEYASIGILSGLEPLLGVINCCLPLLRPVLQKLLGALGSDSISNTKNSSRPSFLHSIGSKRVRALVRDPYPLDTVGTMNGVFHVGDGTNQAGEDGDSIEQLVNNKQSINRITIKRDLEITYHG